MATLHSSSPGGARSVALFAGLLLLVSAAIYGSSLPFPFVFDDLNAIVDNTTLRAGSLWAALSPPDDTPVSGRPLVNLSFALNQKLFGASAVSFRAVNIALHVLNALLLFVVSARVWESARASQAMRAQAVGWAALGTLLWACHPLQTEAVVYVTQRTELLAATFVLLGSWAALRYLQAPARDARRWLLMACLCCALGAGCKETLVALPCIVLVIDRVCVSASLRRAVRAHGALYLGLCCALAPLLLQLVTAPRGRSAGLGLGISPWQWLALSAHAILTYLRLVVSPAGLTVTYNWSVQDAWSRHAPELLPVAATALLGLWLLRRGHAGALLLAVFFAVLAPSSSVVPILSEVAAERRMYLPLVAPVFGLVLGLAALSVRARPQIRRLAWSGGLILACSWGLQAHARTQDYRSAAALFGAALRVDPENPMAMWGLAQALAERGQTREALDWYERMAARPYPYVGPASWGTRGLLAASRLYARLGDEAAARRTQQRALEHDPQSAVGRLQRAARLVAEGRETQAIALLESMQRQPYLLDRVQRELAVLYRRRAAALAAQAHRLASEPTAR